MLKQQALVTLFIVIGLLSALAVAGNVKAQYGYTPVPTTAPTTPPSATSSPTPTPLPTATSSGTNLVLYEGPLTSGATSSMLFGFGDTATDITTPGPTLNLIEGTTYTMTIYNVDPSTRHAWEIVPTKAVSSAPLFGAGIDITNFIPAGGSGSVTFTASQAGSFYYVCTQPGHIGYGMYGSVVVTSSAIPEYPAPTIFLFTMLTIAAASALLFRQKNKISSSKLHK